MSCPRRIFASLFILLSAGCTNHAPVKPVDTEHSHEEFTSEQHRFRVSIPAGWERRASDDYVIEMWPTDDERNGAPRISIDVPSLPPHLPGMIRMSLVRNGFLDDLRKRYPDVHIDREHGLTLPNSTAKSIATSWTLDDATVEQRAALIIHSGRVYILRGTARSEDGKRLQEAFDSVLASLRWIG